MRRGELPHGRAALRDRHVDFDNLDAAAEQGRRRLLRRDGRDTSSWLSGDEVVEEARGIGMVVHAIEMHESLRASPLLSRLTRAAGGRTWSASSSKDLQNLFTRALDEMRARYLLTFTPQGVAREGWHDLRVTLKNARGDVTARPAYFVPPTR